MLVVCLHDCKGVAHHDVYEIRDRELIIYINRNLYFGIYCIHAVGFSIYHYTVMLALCTFYLATLCYVLTVDRLICNICVTIM